MLISRVLYSYRSKPLYAFNLLCGFDDKGNGIVNFFINRLLIMMLLVVLTLKILEYLLTPKV